MEEYYLVVIQNETAQTVYRYDNLDDALRAYHAELAYRAEDRTVTKCVILNSDLWVVKSEVYRADGDSTSSEDI